MRGRSAKKHGWETKANLSGENGWKLISDTCWRDAESHCRYWSQPGLGSTFLSMVNTHRPRARRYQTSILKLCLERKHLICAYFSSTIPALTALVKSFSIAFNISSREEDTQNNRNRATCNLHASSGLVAPRWNLWEG